MSHAGRADPAPISAHAIPGRRQLLLDKRDESAGLLAGMARASGQHRPQVQARHIPVGEDFDHLAAVQLFLEYPFAGYCQAEAGQQRCPKALQRTDAQLGLKRHLGRDAILGKGDLIAAFAAGQDDGCMFNEVARFAGCAVSLKVARRRDEDAAALAYLARREAGTGQLSHAQSDFGALFHQTDVAVVQELNSNNAADV